MTGFADVLKWLATWLFLIGICGSLAVIVISFFEDLREILHKD